MTFRTHWLPITPTVQNRPKSMLEMAGAHATADRMDNRADALDTKAKDAATEAEREYLENEASKLREVSEKLRYANS